jgi:uncharacterized protein (DUF488 family)
MAPVAKPAIWTIGYEGATQADVIATLRSAGVEVLADIRYLPLSRRPGFSKSGLAAASAEAGIAYRHFKQLGTPPEGRAAARRGDHAGLAQSYAGQLELLEAMAQMSELRDLASTKRTALLCFEREPAHCHRILLHAALFEDFHRIDLTPALAGA